MEVRDDDLRRGDGGPAGCGHGLGRLAGNHLATGQHFLPDLGYMVSHQLSAQLAPHFPGDPVVARALAMMAIYAAVSGGVFLAAWMFRSTFAS